ncbi:hypothetical protein SADUNF_Sadunf19G0067200 [Salix dunnii]|uniref:DUF7804 domain-containing protein n=1 Tax=Salix dunnii TaxID=1413687 RepID=A0A835J0U5_9ROSI|nr:hypothetical protein SADUNF_Sadunf19G0067200 [Salix dunnii]
MASVGIRLEGNGFSRVFENNPIKNAHLGPCNVKISGNLRNGARFGKGRVSMSMKSITTPGIVKADDSSDGNKKSAVLFERVEQWMRDSVVEIVNNLREAPLLVHVYSEESGETTMLKTEKAAVEEKWPGLMEKWEKRETQLPDGVIFVEKLEDDEEKEEDAITRAWGIVVQGRGVDCGPVCYLLKTSRVGAGPGLGLCCTHFCLMKVQSFRETARSQLKNCWLSQGL